MTGFEFRKGCRLDFLLYLRRLATLPVDLTLGLKDVSRDGETGPIFLILLPLIIYYFLIRRSGAPFAFGGTLFFAFWHYLYWTAGVSISRPLFQSRLLLPGVVALCPLMAWLLADLSRYDLERFSLQKQLNLVFGVVLFVGLAFQFVGWLLPQPWVYLTGTLEREEYLSRTLGSHYRTMTYLNRELPEEVTVLMLWEPRSYYCAGDCRPDSILDKFGHAQYLYEDSDKIADVWRSQDVDYVLVYEEGLEFLLEADSDDEDPLPPPPTLVDLRQDHFDEVEALAEDAYTLYKLKR